MVSILMSDCSSQFFNVSPNNLEWNIRTYPICIYRWMVLPAGPLTAPVGQLQVRQPRTTVHRRFTCFNPRTPPGYGGKDVSHHPLHLHLLTDFLSKGFGCSAELCPRKAHIGAYA